MHLKAMLDLHLRSKLTILACPAFVTSPFLKTRKPCTATAWYTCLHSVSNPVYRIQCAPDINYDWVRNTI